MMKDQEAEKTIPHEAVESIKQLFNDLPEAFNDRYKTLRALRMVFHQQLAASIEPTLNEQLKHRRAKTIPERRKLASWVDQVTRDLGLTVKSEIHQRPAVLIGDYRGRPHTPSATGYALLAHTSRGLAISEPSHNLPHLHLMPSSSDVDDAFYDHRNCRGPGYRR